MIIGPIIVVEDDADDRLFIQQAIAKCGLNNTIHFFSNGLEALEYLMVTPEKPFIIFCDINMPVMNGLDLRREINKSEYLRNKSIPFVFLTTAANPRQIVEGYELTIQGYFKKPISGTEMHEMILDILNYWNRCLHPNNIR